MFRISLLCLLAAAGSAYSFTTPSLSFHNPASKLRGAASAATRRQSSCAVKMMDGRVDRREAIATSFLAALGSTLLSNKEAQAAGVALGYSVSEKEVNSQLEAFGLAAFNKVQSGFKPLIQTVGGNVGANIDGSKVVDSLGSLVTSNGGLKTGERLLVLFQYPSSWIVSLPITTPNGESGTVSANNYVKGDSAVVSAKKMDGASLDALPNKFYDELITASNNLYQGFKILKKTPAEPIDGQPAINLEFRYELLTDGPIVGRHGFAKCILTGSNVIALSATTTDSRFKGLKDSLKSTADSFRSHIVKQEFEKASSNGLNFKMEDNSDL